MSSYKVHLVIELEDGHGFPFSKDLLKYLLVRDLIDHGETSEAFCINSLDVEGIDYEGIPEMAPRLQ